MAGVTVSNGSSFVPVKDIAVSNGSTFVQAKKMKVYNGSTWVLTWVPRVPVVTLSFSKTGVVTNEHYTITTTLSIPAPEGTYVHYSCPGVSWESEWLLIPEGATTHTIDAAQGAAGSYTFYADVWNLGGLTTSAGKTQTVTAPAPTHYHVTVPSGSSGSAIQTAMTNARTWWLANKNTAVNFDDEQSFACVELVANGIYDLAGTELHPRRGVRLVGGGSGTTRPWVNGTSPSTHVVNTDNNGGGAYNSPDYDWMIHNIRFNCTTYSGGMSIAHTKRFRVSECYFTNMGGKKHYIEVNSSGNVRADGTYNCQIINCEFQNSNTTTTNGEPRRCEDECVQMDYSWAGAASAVANDGTISNNVLIQGCNFHDAPRAIGSHAHGYPAKPERHPPNGHHGNILIQNNTFTNIDPDQYGGGDAPNGTGSEGAVRCYVWNNVQILNNTFNDCFQPINLYINDDSPANTGNPTRYRIAGNVFNSKTSSRACINGTSANNAGKRHEQILAENNTFNGTWGGSDYFIGFQDTGCSDYPGLTYPVVIRNNRFQPSNMNPDEEKGYNKYRADGGDNCGSADGVYASGNTVSDGQVDNS